MRGEGQHDKLAVTDFVRNNTAADDAETEPDKAGTTNGTQLCTGETIGLSPVVKDSTSNGESYASRKDGHKASPQ
jgi:hypothetical protein